MAQERFTLELYEASKLLGVELFKIGSKKAPKSFEEAALILEEAASNIRAKAIDTNRGEK